VDGGYSELSASQLLTDAQLVTLALSGVPRAFSRLLERHARHLRRILAKRLRNPEDVLDVLQDTHLAAWRALRTYDLERPFEAWLTSIALNKYRDWARHRAAQFGLLSRMHADALEARLGIDERSAERLAIDQECLRELARALGRLPAQLREPLLLTTLAECSQAAVARELSLTRKAVEMRVRRARARLAQTLAGEAWPRHLAAHRPTSLMNAAA
jgi:RNA polymerase sigma factor CnrH